MTDITINKVQSRVNNLFLDMCNLQADIDRAGWVESCDYDEMLEIAKQEMLALAKRVAERMEQMANAKTTHVTFAGVKASVRHLG